MRGRLQDPRQIWVRAHARFVAKYLVDRNGARAASRAGYSKRTARVKAAQLLAKETVRQVVATGARKQPDKVELKAEKVLASILSGRLRHSGAV